MQAQAASLGGQILTEQQEHAKALAERLEAEKEKRIAHIQEMAVRRLVTRGWSPRSASATT